MNTEVWPFLVGCNRTLGYHVIVSPQFLSDAAHSHLLLQITGGDDSAPRSATAREIRGSKIGTITVIFRAIRAQAQEYGIEGNGVLKDRVGRPIRLFEGVVVQGDIEDIQQVVITEKDLGIAHEKVKTAYQVFWEVNEGFAEQTSQAFILQTPANAADQVTLKVEAPLEVRNSSATEESDIPVTKHSDSLLPVSTKIRITSSITLDQKQQAYPTLSLQSMPRSKTDSTTSHRNAHLPLILRRRFSFVMGIVLVIAITILLFPLVSQFIHPTPTSNVPPGIGPDGIGVTLVDGEYIGISDGRYTLDTNRDAGPLMTAASESLRNGNLGPALAEWNAAHEKDTNDAEPLIYAENQRVLASGSPYITIVLGVALGENVSDGFSRDALQGAYVLQRECNNNPQISGGKKLRLLIARSGSNPDRVKDIARQIVQAAQFDKTIVGVQGWTTSVTTLNALPTLVQAHLPIVASNATSDELTNISPYFFRVGVPNRGQTSLITTYIEKQLKSQHLVVFRDPKEPYSFDASNDFVQQFVQDGYNSPLVEEFTTADTAGLAQQVQKALSTYKPDLIYIPSNTVGDVQTLLNTIPTTAEYANLKVFTGGVGYELVQPGEQVPGYTRMLISISAFPDDWKILGSGDQPPFFTDYPAVYDPHNQHSNSPYTYSRATGVVMLTYDALSAFLAANKNAIQQGKQNPTSEDIKNALSQINGSQSFQGITGTISFGPDSNPIDKEHFILRVVGGYTHLAAYRGCFLVGSSCDNSIHILE